MSTMVLEAMRRAISDVLEMMFFLPVQITDNNCDLSEWFSIEKPLVATMGFNGPVSGISYLVMTADVAREIAANFLGLNQEEINNKHEGDVVKEALNMIVGKMLVELDKGGAFRLGIPELIQQTKSGLMHLSGSQCEGVLIETGKNRLAAGIALNK